MAPCVAHYWYGFSITGMVFTLLVLIKDRSEFGKTFLIFFLSLSPFQHNCCSALHIAHKMDTRNYVFILVATLNLDTKNSVFILGNKLNISD